MTRDFLNGRECGIGTQQKVRVQQAALTSYSPSQKYDIVTMGMTGLTADAGEDKQEEVSVFRTNIKNLETRAAGRRNAGGILNISGPEGSALTSVPFENEYNFFVYFAGQVQPMEKMKGIRADDEDKYGVFHYLLGRQRGLIKNIKLSKTQTKGLAEVRFEQDGWDSLQQLRVIYDVQIDSYANVNTWPGTYIYVDPAGFLPKGSADLSHKDLTAIGIGGYYMIIRSEHEFGPGTANSTIHAKWVNSVESAQIDASCQALTEAKQGSGEPENPACRWADEGLDEQAEAESPGLLGRAAGWIGNIF